MSDVNILEVVEQKYPTVGVFNKTLLDIQPSHETFLRKRFEKIGEEEAKNLEEIADKIKDLIGDDLKSFVEDYNWLCEEQLKEELYFRRNGKYRLTTAQEAYDEVYSDKEYMTRYMNGLLITQIWWSNHSQMLNFYKNDFLGTNKPGYKHLEVGPGHGLLLYYACNDDKAGDVSAWDISQASIDSCTHALEILGVKKAPNITLVDMFLADSSEKFDSIVFSEVLEHMEEPERALQALRNVLADDGRIFIHIPINSPAPDHLFNVKTPQLMGDFIRAQGLTIEKEFFAPLTNYSLEKAIKMELTVSCGFICKKA